ncbi:MAG: hypothetical protein EBV46_00215, partial [Burkholderiaceae bacterium]|nr:hypothetical protein [Burkholderiaceae bacterium]
RAAAVASLLGEPTVDTPLSVVEPEPEAPLDGSAAADPIEPDAPAAPAEPHIAAPFTMAAPVFAPSSDPVDTSPFPPAQGGSPFPPLEPPLVLTPATEADFIDAARPAWSPDERPTAQVAADDTVLFDDEPTLSVLRHEVEPGHPRRFDWNESGAFLGMGVVGLIAFGASAAAFRLSVDQPSPMGETTVLAWALAAIGLICVGVSSWNLYVRWGRGE